MRSLIRLYSLAALLSAAAIAAAQSGSVTGTVIDNEGETLPGANVYLTEDLSIGTTTDIDGEFVLSKVPVGTQSITISFAGFESDVREVTVAEDTPAEVEVVLGGSAVMGEVVIVTAQALGQAKAINQQLNSDAIANFVSADRIKELPDVNAAEAISRLPGVAINRSGGEGSKVVVRGLDPKFTAISINGVRLPATSGTDRSVDLSLISPELLSGIELFKSPTPDMDGDALGGSINLNVIKAPKERRARLKALGGYNGLADTWSDYKFTGSYSQRVLNGKIGLSVNANVERFNRSGEVLRLGWQDDPKDTEELVEDVFAQEGTSLTYDARREARTRQNGSLGIDFNLGDRTETTFLGIFSRTGRDQFGQVERYDRLNNRFSFTPNIRESSIRLFSGSVSTRHAFDAFKVEWGAAFTEVVGETPYDLDVEFRRDPVAFDNTVNDSLNRIVPEDYRDFIRRDSTAEYLQNATIVNSSNNEAITSAFVDLSVPFRLGGAVSATFKTGGKVRISERVRSYDEFTNTQGLYLLNNEVFDELGTLPATGRDPSGGNYFSAHNFTIPVVTTLAGFDGNEVSLLNTFDEGRLRRFRDFYEREGLNEKNRFQEVNDYRLDEAVYAYYGMLKFKIGRKLTVIPGVRVEMSDNQYFGNYADLRGPIGNDGELVPVEVDRAYTNVLPHFHTKFQATDWFDIRASYSTTLARPDYDYIVPFTLVDRGGAELTIDRGNPELEASVSENLDLYLTAFKGEYGLFSVGVFRKNISDAFFPFFTQLNDSTQVAEAGLPPSGFTGAILSTFSNTADSYVDGVEFEIQSNLNFLPDPLDGLVANLNYSILNSETTINGFTQETVNTCPGRRRPCFENVITPITREVDVLGQAAQIFNASLGYDRGKVSTRVSASYQGSKLSGYAGNGDKDRFNAAFWRFDAAIVYKATPALNFLVNLNNLSNQRDINFFRNPSFRTSVSTFGPTGTFGARYIFFR